MKIYKKENGYVTLIIPETQEEADRVKKIIDDNTIMEGICKNAEIIPGDIFIKYDKDYRYAIPRGEYKNED